MPLSYPVVIKGRIVGAYKDEPEYQIQGQDGLTGLTEIINYLLGSGGSGSPDGNGIYSGSGNVPDGTVATAQGSFKFASDGKSIIFGKDDSNSTPYSFLYKRQDGTWGIGISETVSSENLQCDFQVYKFGIRIETDSGTSPGVTQFNTNKDYVSISASNSSLSKVVIFKVTPISILLSGIPNYTNDAAADADSALLSGSLYTITGSRALLKKP